MDIVLGLLFLAIAYIFITGKKRRRKKFSTEIERLVYSSQNSVILEDVYFDAALKYALESGAELERGESMLHTTSIHFSKKIDGINYFIFFSKMPDGSTYLGVSNSDEVKQRIRKDAGLI